MSATKTQMSFGDLINAVDLVLVDFHAAWCAPCKMMKSILEEVKGFIGNNAKIVKVAVLTKILEPHRCTRLREFLHLTI